jgi:peptide/nickel transport system permease protein
MGATIETVDIQTASAPARQRTPFLKKATATAGGQVGVSGIGLLVLLVVFGPLLAPHSVSQIVGAPFAPPSSATPLGTDYLGRDVLSRFLYGGRLLPIVAVGSATLAYLLALPIGILSGLTRGRLDQGIVWLIDLLLSIPALIVGLLMLAALGSGVVIIGIAITAVSIPPIIRMVRAATFDQATNEYVEAAVARGERKLSIALREVLPNIRPAIIADYAVRLAFAVILYASLGFLGLGVGPPAADWGLMVSENHGGLLVNPWAVVVPAVAIACITVSITLVADALGRSRVLLGR